MSLVLRYLISSCLVKESFGKPVKDWRVNIYQTRPWRKFRPLDYQWMTVRDKDIRNQDMGMAESEKVIESRIWHRYPNTIYIHFYSHILNLCVIKHIKKEQVKNMFEFCRTISDFLNNSLNGFNYLKMFCKILDTRRHKNALIFIKLENKTFENTHWTMPLWVGILCRSL